MDKNFEKVTDGEPSRDALLFRDAYFFLMETEHPAEPEKNITYHERLNWEKPTNV